MTSNPLIRDEDIASREPAHAWGEDRTSRQHDASRGYVIEILLLWVSLWKEYRDLQQASLSASGP